VKAAADLPGWSGFAGLQRPLEDGIFSLSKGYLPGAGRRITKGKTNMAQAIMDPEEVRRFAQELKKFNADLQNGMASLQARFAALADTWADQEHQKFAEEFKQTMKALKKFIEVSNQHSPYLLRKAQRIEEYLNQH
jgi:uncharacterized protein YukE